MSRDATFWRWYANVADSIRHDVVERPWFQRETSQDITAEDMPGVQTQESDPQPEASHSPAYPSPEQEQDR